MDVHLNTHQSSSIKNERRRKHLNIGMGEVQNYDLITSTFVCSLIAWEFLEKPNQR